MVYSDGWHAVWNIIKQCGSAIDSAMRVLAQIAFQFRDEIGITDWVWTRGIYAVIAIAAALLSGYAFTRKEQKKLLGIIGSVVSLVSTILTFA